MGTGRLREGDNRYDFRLGDSDFGGVFTTPGFFGPGSNAAKDFSYVSDFDNGLAANDASCVIAVEGFGLAASSKYCNLGRGAREASTAGGDSGGPQFGADGRLLSVTSYGLTFGSDFGDFDDDLNSSWGELNGFVPLWIHRDFITGAVPEPQTWAMMLLGFGMLGAGIRVRARKIALA
ncbi:MAG: PEPxxWA-CTERM sorting domain-containing protein [Proteobacteria bacterium]|nr:PEPxxWA-CTERM sorting domain-containing protein [Pseudomonadota bacterium]